MNKLTQEAKLSLRGRMFQRDNARPKERRILVLKTGVAGLKHYIKNEEEAAAIKMISPGTELILFREPDNEYDEWAIAVHLTEDDKIGFVSRFKNETIARMMDAGKKFIGVVDDPLTDENAKNVMKKEQNRSVRAPTENMNLPFSIYLIEEA